MSKVVKTSNKKFCLAVNATITITVHSGKNLISADSNGFSDPYISFQLANTKKFNVDKRLLKSKIKKKTLNPKWEPNEATVVFSDAQITNESEVILHVLDMDLIGSDDPLGQVKIPAYLLFRGTEKPHKWTEARLITPTEKMAAANTSGQKLNLGELEITCECTYTGRKPSKRKLYSRPTGYFCQGLDALLARPDQYSFKVPILIFSGVRFLDAHDAHLIEGIFRISGSHPVIKSYREKFDSTDDVSKIEFPDNLDIHVVSGLITLFLRESPEPIFPYETYPAFIKAGRIADPSSRLGAISYLVNEVLPTSSYDLAKFLLAYVYKLSKYSSENAMTTKNLSTVLRSSFLRPDIPSMSTMFIEMPASLTVLDDLITHFSTIFAAQRMTQSSSSEHGSRRPSSPQKPKPKPKSKSKPSAVALYEYESAGEGELSMYEGENFEYISSEDGWALVQNENGEEGFVPENYIEIN